MEQAIGRVIAIQTASAPVSAEVEVSGSVTCARCASGRGCGAALLGSGNGNRRIAARIASGIHVQEGDEVCMELESRRLLLASWLVYGTPLAAALVASVAAYLAGLPDLYAALAASGGAGAGVVFARSRLRKTTCLRQFMPTIVARVPVAR
jgi:sigma-E factor negative regulatory protein RseC